MNLDLFKTLDSYSGMHDGHFFISSHEENILTNYDDIRKLLENSELKSVNVVAHCADQAIPYSDFEKRFSQIKNDLNQYENFKFVLIVNSPYHWNFNFKIHENFLYIFYPEYQGIYWPIYKDESPISPRPIKKHFLSLNKRADLYRQILYYIFCQRNWVDKSYFSYLGENYLNGNIFSSQQFAEIDAAIKNSKYFGSLTIPDKNFLQLDNDMSLDSYKEKSLISEFDSTWKPDINLFKNSFCSIVVETAATGNVVNLSEKTFRAIVYKHPLLLFGAPKTHQFMIESLGLDFGIYQDSIIEWDVGNINDLRFLNFINFIEKIANLNVDDLTLLSKLLDNKTSYLRDQYRHVYNNMLTKQAVILHNIKKFIKILPD